MSSELLIECIPDGGVEEEIWKQNAATAKNWSYLPARGRTPSHVHAGRPYLTGAGGSESQRGRDRRFKRGADNWERRSQDVGGTTG